MRTSHILVPFEISSASYKAFRTALDIAKDDKAKLTVLTVVNSNGKSSSSGLEQMLPEMVLAEYDQRRIVTEWPKMLKDAQNMNVEFDASLTDSFHPAEGIVNYAQKNNVDLIIMGNREKKDFKNDNQGSVSQKVIELHPPCQVLIVN